MAVFPFYLGKVYCKENGVMPIIPLVDNTSNKHTRETRDMTNANHILEVNSNNHPAMNAAAAKVIAVAHALEVMGYDEAEIVTETVNHSLANDSVEVLVRCVVDTRSWASDGGVVVEHWNYMVQGDTVENIDDASTWFMHCDTNDETIELHSRVIMNG